MARNSKPGLHRGLGSRRDDGSVLDSDLNLKLRSRDGGIHLLGTPVSDAVGVAGAGLETPEGDEVQVADETLGAAVDEDA